PGTGLGAVRRMSAFFDIYSQLGTGTAVFAEVGARRAPGALEIGAVSIPIPSETVCGDGWAVMEDGRRTIVLVVDGLGHGTLAADRRVLIPMAAGSGTGDAQRRHRDAVGSREVSRPRAPSSRAHRRGALPGFPSDARRRDGARRGLHPALTWPRSSRSRSATS